MNQVNEQIDTLTELLESIGPLRVAVSGGVDSMTMGLLAGRYLGHATLICHAVSAAVPAEATERVRRIAEREGWQLQLLDAGEFDDSHYLSNPYDRCFHCKSSLYTAMNRITGDGRRTTLLSGANLDDLDDYRPGLIAARQHGVRHPFVECSIDKPGVRRIARHLGYPELARLPASPCLSSRIETGLPIRAEHLGFVHRVERSLQLELQPAVVRCRLLSSGITIQLDPDALERLNDERQRWRAMLEKMAEQQGLPQLIHFEPYRMGSAFVPPK
ncbi:MAG: adenine nucleotide alpha hydrolase [bacterium]|nr:adenine nucleotide alpha hydrolase [bacterium]